MKSTAPASIAWPSCSSRERPVRKATGSAAALRAQGAQHVEARHLRQAPVDQRRLGLEAGLHGGEKGRAIGEGHDRIAVILEVGRHDLAIEVVVIDQDDPGGHARA